MRRYNLTRGAKTTAGGTVLTGSATVELMGEPLAREGDLVDCPACGTQGVIVCHGPHLCALASGGECALEGDLCQCACSPAPTLIANQSLMFQAFEAPSIPGPAAYSKAGVSGYGAGPVGAFSQSAGSSVQPAASSALEEEEEEDEPGAGRPLP